MKELQPLDKTLIQSDPFFILVKKEMDSFVDPGDKVLVSVSGGMDSMALLSLLSAMDTINIHVAHINHQLRDESTNDANFVQEVCDSLNVPIYTTILDPSSISTSESVEAWGRHHRYQFLKETANKKNIDWILTAHHANDQAETILFNLSRKTGVAGLRGIAKESGQLLRPLLNFPKIEIKQFVQRCHILFREDKTNTNKTIPRNFLRHEILKKWEKKSPEVITSLNTSTQHFSEWVDALDFVIKESYLPKVTQSDNEFYIRASWFNSMPKMAKIHLVRILTEKEYSISWSKHDLDGLNSFLLKEEVGHQLTLKNGWCLLWDREKIIGQKVTDSFRKDSVELFPNQPVDFSQYRYELLFQDMGQSKALNDETEQVDWSKIMNAKLEIRHWKKGDAFQPLGMQGHQKISDYLINEKIDRFSKKDQTVLTANGDIVWVCGKRIADWVKITPDTTTTAVISRRQLTT